MNLAAEFNTDPSYGQLLPFPNRQKLEERKQKRILAKKNNSLPVLMCSQCGYRTKEKYQFKVHMNNHNGIKDFK